MHTLHATFVSIITLTLATSVVQGQTYEIKHKPDTLAMDPNDFHFDSDNRLINHPQDNEEITENKTILEELLHSIFIAPIESWQENKIANSEDPTLVSLEASLNSSIYPSDYYIITPHIRGKIGLFGMENRFEQLLDRKYGNTRSTFIYNWQVLQLHMITMKKISGYIGGGLLLCNAWKKGYATEWVAGFDLRPSPAWGASCELRLSKERREQSLSIEHVFIQKSPVYISVFSGLLFHQYPYTSNQWAVQTGLVLRVY